MFAKIHDLRHSVTACGDWRFGIAPEKLESYTQFLTQICTLWCFSYT